MKLSFSTVGCPDWTWGDITATARDLGYDGFEVRGVGKDLYAPRIPQFGAERAERTRAQLRELELCVPCLDSDAQMQDGKRVEANVGEIMDYVALAKRMGVGYVRVMADKAVPAPTEPVDEGIVLEVMQAARPAAEEAGVTLLVESNGWYADTKRLAGLIGRIGGANIGALWDLHHPYRFFGESPEKTVGNLGGWIKHVHMKDSTGTKEGYRYRMIGYGDLPIRGFVEALNGIGYDGFYSLEWVKRWDLTLEEPGIAFAQFVGYMRGMGR